MPPPRRRPVRWKVPLEEARFYACASPPARAPSLAGRAGRPLLAWRWTLVGRTLAQGSPVVPGQLTVRALRGPCLLALAGALREALPPLAGDGAVVVTLGPPCAAASGARGLQLTLLPACAGAGVDVRLAGCGAVRHRDASEAALARLLDGSLAALDVTVRGSRAASLWGLPLRRCGAGQEERRVELPAPGLQLEIVVG
jgi:hypothetical protein